MIAELTQKHSYSIDEYLDLEQRSEVRHEFVDGYLIEMAGESKVANEICGNLEFTLRLQLPKGQYKVYNHDVKLQTAVNKRIRYPDLMIVPSSDNRDTHIVYEAILTAEVTSENSSGVDHDDKFHEYIALPSVQCYLIIAQTEPLLEVYQRSGSKWEYAYYTDLHESFTIHSLGVTLTLKDVYEGVF